MEIVRKRRKPMSDINVVPYIDVMLVLLIVFMVTAPLLTQGLRVDLPQVDSEPMDMDENAETLVIELTAENEFFISLGVTEQDEQTPVELSTIGQQVASIVEVNPTIQIFIEGDASASYGPFISLMEALRVAGVDSPNLVTKPLE
ncbi:ExbD/TolR family protein [Pseudohongiella sp.]|uniref:Tol-Pal system protein TolR n=1 Tax=marine sediment metagenome TaxID=412755 RepID=A0A0F9W312_9ZZZZ|nr:ExbD/TolR family protein [Pseudohongiella sp.]HDZ09121.1 ExbD/TolR family protein [Pseudohongiella sp.]HEA63543.1 ExbD/TolR family protein [Pseudohongiella sp.]